MRGKPNVHGHCHAEQLDDPRYLNVAIEHLPHMRPLTLEQVRAHWKQARVEYGSRLAIERSDECTNP